MHLRRKFMLNTGLVIGSIATGSINLIAASNNAAGSAEADVLKAIQQFGTVTRQSKRSKRVEYTVKLQSAESLGRVFTGNTPSRFDKVYAEGNRLKFNHGGVDFTLTNVA